LAVWNINAATDLIASMAQSTYISDSNSNHNLAAGNVSAENSEYARLLAEKISEVDSQMNNTQNQSGDAQNFNQAETDSSGNSMHMIETLRRIMPDGSIRIVTYKDGEAVSSMELKPHTVMTPDYSLPPDPSGEPGLKAEQRLSLAALLMA